MTLSELSELARRHVEDSKGTLAAQWILQNPDKNVADYVFIFRHRYDMDDMTMEFSIDAVGKF